MERQRSSLVASTNSITFIANVITRTQMLRMLWMLWTPVPRTALLRLSASTGIRRARSVTCATQATRRRRERCDPDRSEVQVPPLPHPLPVRKLLAECKPAVLGEAKEVKLRVIRELRAALLPEVRLDVVQVRCAEVHHCLGRLLGGFVVVLGHGTSVLCVLGKKKYPQARRILERRQDQSRRPESR